MASRGILQEIPITPSPSQLEDSFTEDVMEDEGTTTPRHSKQPLPSRRRPVDTSTDECKENLTPVPSEYNIQEKYIQQKIDPTVTKESRIDVPNDTNHPDSGNFSKIKSGNNTGFCHLDSLQPDSCNNVGMKVWNFSTPSKNGQESDLLNEARHTPIDYSKVTVDDFGISTDSFTKCAGKSPKSLLKHRRRSTIGVRGSPEMNFLIRQIAQQKCKRKEEPEPLINPFSSPRNFMLKDKISAFRDAFQTVEETDGKVQNSASLNKEALQTKGADVRDENVKPPEKKKRPCVSFHPVRERGQQCAPTHNSQSEKFPVTSPENIHQSESTFISTMLPELSSTTTPMQVHDVPPSYSEETSIVRKTRFEDLLRPAVSGQTQAHQQPLQKEPPATQPSPFLRPVLKKTPKREIVPFEGFRIYSIGEEEGDLSNEESCSNTELAFKRPDAVDSVRKKKVTFGRQLSPEVFDKTLPPNTPLRRGGTPYNFRSSDSTTPVTAEMSTDSLLYPLPQPDFGVDLQPLSLCFDAETCCNDSPSASQGWMDETRPNQIEDDVKMSVLQTELAASPTLTVCSLDDSSGFSLLDAGDMNEAILLTPEPVKLSTSTRETRCTAKRKFCQSEENPNNTTEQNNTSKTLTKTSLKRKTQKTKKMVKIVTKKPQAKVARGKGKKTRGKFKKSVQRSLYGERATASRKPLLSPIVELPETYPTPPSSTGYIFTYDKMPELRDDVKNAVKKVVKTKRCAQRTCKTVKDIGDCSIQPDTDSETRNLEAEGAGLLMACLEGDAEPAVYEQDFLKLDSRELDHNDVCTKSPDQLDSAEANLDSFHHSESQMPIFPTKKEILIEDVSNTVENGTFTAVTDEAKEASDLSNFITKRRSSTRKCLSQTVLEEGPTVLRESMEQGLNVVNPSPESTGDPCSVNNKVLQSHEFKGDPSEDLDSPSLRETILALTTETLPAQKSRRSSRNYRRATIFCLSSENVAAQNSPGELRTARSPQAGESAISYSDDMSYCLDEALQITPSKRKVRRSMRLRRDSGVIGLSWVQDEKLREGAGRRKSLSLTAVEQATSPSRGLESMGLSPSNVNKKSEPASSDTRKSRRRTLCTSSLQSSINVTDSKRRRSSSFKDFTMCHSKVEPSHISYATIQEI